MKLAGWQWRRRRLEEWSMQTTIPFFPSFCFLQSQSGNNAFWLLVCHSPKRRKTRRRRRRVFNTRCCNTHTHSLAHLVDMDAYAHVASSTHSDYVFWVVWCIQVLYLAFFSYFFFFFGFYYFWREFRWDFCWTRLEVSFFFVYYFCRFLFGFLCIFSSVLVVGVMNERYLLDVDIGPAYMPYIFCFLHSCRIIFVVFSLVAQFLFLAWLGRLSDSPKECQKKTLLFHLITSGNAVLHVNGKFYV